MHTHPHFHRSPSPAFVVFFFLVGCSATTDAPSANRETTPSAQCCKGIGACHGRSAETGGGPVATSGGNVSKTDLDRWLAQLENDDYRVRYRASLRLVRAGRPAIPSVMRHLEEGGAHLDYHGNHSPAMKVLEKLGQAAVPPLVARLRALIPEFDDVAAVNKVEDLAYYLMVILGTIGDERAVPVFLEILERRRSRGAMATVIDQFRGVCDWTVVMGDPPMRTPMAPGQEVERLQRLLRETIRAEVVRTERDELWLARDAIRLLGDVGTQDDVEFLLKSSAFARSAEDHIALAAAHHALGSSHWPSHLMTAIKLEGAYGLREYGADLPYFDRDLRLTFETALELLRMALDEDGGLDSERPEEFEVYGGRVIAGHAPEACAEILRAITFQDFGPDLDLWKSWWADNLNRRRAEWMEQAVERFMAKYSALEAPYNHSIDGLLQDAIGLRDARVAAVVSRYVRWNTAIVDAQKSRAALDVLARMGGKEALEAMAHCLSENTPWRRDAVMSALRGMEWSTAEPIWRQAMKSKAAGIRRSAAIAYFEHGNKSAMDDILEIMDRSMDQYESAMRFVSAYFQDDFGYRPELGLREKAEVLRTCREWWRTHRSTFDVREAVRRKEIDFEFHI